jgi:hypothetical protein
MENTKAVRQLTWKYFFEQKWEEVGNIIIALAFVLGCILFVIVPPFLVKQVAPDFYCNTLVANSINPSSIYTTNCLGMEAQTIVTLSWMTLSMIFFLVITALYGTYFWLRDNYTKARQRAIKEVGRKRK